MKCIHAVELTAPCHWCKEQAARFTNDEYSHEDAYRLLYLGPDGVLIPQQSDRGTEHG